MKKLILIFLIILCCSGCASIHSTQTVMLISEEDANLPDAPEEETAYGFTMGKEADTGPEIKVIEPGSGDTYNSPINIRVDFIPKEGTEIDISKLKVEYIKFINIDKTEELIKYISQRGIRAENISLWRGEHKIRLTVGDTKGGISKYVFKIRVI